MTIYTTGAYDLPAIADRNRNSMMLAAGTGTLGVIDGVHSGMNISKTTGMGFAIGAGRAAVNGTSAADGTYTVTFTSNVTDSFADGDASNDRYDLVTIQTNPTNPSTSGADVVVVKGTASSSPAVPATPAGSLALFAVRIVAGTSASTGGWSTSKMIDKRRAIGVPEFIDYTPTFGGFANLGTGAVRRGRYRLDGDKCSVQAHLVGGTDAAFGGSALYFTLPVPAQAGWIYYGQGGLHHPDFNGKAYRLMLITNGNSAWIWTPDDTTGAYVSPGQRGYPFAKWTEIFCNLEYVVDLP